MDLQRDFYKKVEDVGYLNHVLYSDTDSIYICIPTDINNFTIDQKLDLASVRGGFCPNCGKKDKSCWRHWNGSLYCQKCGYRINC